MAGKLSARKVATAGPGEHSDGDGLYLRVKDSGSKTWVYRFSWRGRRPEMGLGCFADGVGLAEAREARDAAKKLVKAGRNPIDDRRNARAETMARRTFGECCDDFLASKASGWRNDKHRDQWRMTLTKYAEPIRSMPIDEISTVDVLAVLKPLWQRTPETATRLRGRIEAVLDAARALGLREGENPARWKGNLDHLLPKRAAPPGHHAAMAYVDVPAFVTALRQQEGAAARALEFTILTAARTGEVLGALWPEIDLEMRVWTVPAQRMKGGRIHRVPLSPRAVEVLTMMQPLRTIGDFIFPGARRGRPLSNMGMEMVLRRMGAGDVTVHGFRSSFRDWSGDMTTVQREVAEAALAHIVGDKAEQAYRRGDAMDKRRALMGAWADFIDTQVHSVSEVTALPREGRVGT